MRAETLWAALSPEQVEEGFRVGNARYAAARALNRQHTNNRKAAPSLAQEHDRMGACCELAGRVFIGKIVWNSLCDRPTGTADLGRIVDVKGVSERRHRLIIKPRELRPDWVFFLVSAHRGPALYEMLGWVWGRDVRQDHMAEPQPGRAAYCIDKKDPIMRDPELLIAMNLRGEL